MRQIAYKSNITKSSWEEMYDDKNYTVSCNHQHGDLIYWFYV